MKYLHDVVTLELERDRCTGCGMCTVVCPHAVFVLEGGLSHIADRDACMECGACAMNCPETAITVQTGVGCAQAVLSSALGKYGSSCACIVDDKRSGEGDDGTGPCGDTPAGTPGTGCC